MLNILLAFSDQAMTPFKIFFETIRYIFAWLRDATAHTFEFWRRLNLCIFCSYNLKGFLCGWPLIILLNKHHFHVWIFSWVHLGLSSLPHDTGSSAIKCIVVVLRLQLLLRIKKPNMTYPPHCDCEGSSVAFSR